MPANFKPVFSLVPLTPFVVLTGTTTDKSGATTANMKTLVTSGANGTKVTQIGFKFVGTSTAGTILIFITDTAGANPTLYDEIVYGAVTSSTTANSGRIFNLYSDLQLKSGQLIIVGATTVNTSINVWASQGDF